MEMVKSITPNSSQQKVIDCDGNILLFALAGTGKTNTIALKIAKLITENKARPEQILCLTFTNKGCAEMENRVKSTALGGGDKITVKTFHSYCYSLIIKKALFDKCGVNDYSIFDEDDSAAVIEKVAADVNMLLPTKTVGKTGYRIIDLIKKTAIEKGILESDVIEAGKKVIEDFYGKSKDEFNAKVNEIFYNKLPDFTLKIKKDKLIAFFAKYQNQLELSRAYDFDDLEYLANFALTDENFKSHVENSYSYIFVDEAQDTSFDEYNFIKRISGKAKICLCGDFSQTIYEWRGSRPDLIISDFKQKYNPEIITLGKNYRSSGVIANASFGLLKNMFSKSFTTEYAEKSCSDKTGGEPVYLKSAYDFNDEADFITKSIDENREKDACVLVRTNAYAAALSKRLDKDKFFLVQDLQYYKRNEVKEIIAFLRLILNPYDTVALERIVLKYVNGFGEIKLADVLDDSVYDLGVRLSDFMDVKTHTGGGDLFKLLTDAYDNENIVVFDTETTGTDPASDEIVQIAAIKTDRFGNEIKSLNLLVKSTKSVGDSFNVHGISDELLKEKGIDKETALNMLIDFLGDCVVVGHNVGFDIAMVNAELERKKMPLKKFDFYDTYFTAKRFVKNQRDYKLTTLSESLNLKFKSSHDALDDVRATACLLTYLMDNFIRKTAKQRAAAINKYIGLFRNLAYALENYRNKLYTLPFNEFIGQVVEGLKVRYVYRGNDAALFNVEHFLKLAELLSFNSSSAYNSLKNTINAASFSAGDFDALAKEQNLIPVITVHQAKGCEFNSVYVCGLADGIFPTTVAIKKDNLYEEKRLFYVAFTRAKNRLFLLCPKNYYDYNGQIYGVNPSRFLQSVPKEFIKEI
ncbi:MAG: 3'-5' exonuclease [Clostridia bacterium]|nr:3'-5' exonuclease [Clostridia bacterium]